MFQVVIPKREFWSCEIIQIVGILNPIAKKFEIQIKKKLKIKVHELLLVL